MAKLLIDYPDDLLALPDQTPESLELLAREALLVRLYSLGQIGSGRAAEILGTSRREFLDLLAHYGISIFDEQTDLRAEAQLGRP